MEYNDELERMRTRKQQRRPAPDRSGLAHAAMEEDMPIRKSRVREKTSAARRARKKKKRLILIAELLVLAALIGGIFYYFKFKVMDGYWTIAVFGVDSRDGNVEKALSDVEMLCVIDRKTGEIKLVSVFRDTYMEINSDGTYHKINEAYFKGGHKQAVSALERNLDLKIDDYATFNWKAVADTINILGGIDLEISKSEFKYINGFITETVNSTGIGSVHLEQPGMNHLDGVQAVAYARLRLMDTDYNRTARQRKVISLAMEKAKQADFSVLNNILVTVLPQVSTSIGIDDLIPLAKNMTQYHIGVTDGFPFSRGEANIGKKDCVIPLTLESNVVQLHELLYGTENFQPSSTVKKISAKIASDSGMGEVADNAPKSEAGGGSGGNSAPPATQAPTTQAVEESSSVVPTEESTEESTEETTEETTEEEESSKDSSDHGSSDDAITGPGVNLPTETSASTKPTPPADVEEGPTVPPSQSAPEAPGAGGSGEAVGPGVS